MCQSLRRNNEILKPPREFQHRTSQIVYNQEIENIENSSSPSRSVSSSKQESKIKILKINQMPRDSDPKFVRAHSHTPSSSSQRISPNSNSQFSNFTFGSGAKPITPYKKPQAIILKVLFHIANRKIYELKYKVFRLMQSLPPKKKVDNALLHLLIQTIHFTFRKRLRVFDQIKTFSSIRAISKLEGIFSKNRLKSLHIFFRNFREGVSTSKLLHIKAFTCSKEELADFDKKQAKNSKFCKAFCQEEPKDHQSTFKNAFFHKKKHESDFSSDKFSSWCKTKKRIQSFAETENRKYSQNLAFQNLENIFRQRKFKNLVISIQTIKLHIALTKAMFSPSSKILIPTPSPRETISYNKNVNSGFIKITILASSSPKIETKTEKNLFLSSQNSKSLNSFLPIKTKSYLVENSKNSIVQIFKPKFQKTSESSSNQNQYLKSSLSVKPTRNLKEKIKLSLEKYSGRNFHGESQMITQRAKVKPFLFQ